MKYFILAAMCFASARSFAAHNLQTAECFPNSAEAKDWPVQGIYLAGLYGKGATYDYVENSNRDFLEDYALKNRIRIAVPVARILNGWHQWNGTPLSTIESNASAACGGAPLAEQRAIIGYSNGGRYVGELSGQCEKNKSYTKFIVIGYPEAVRGNCSGNDTRYSAFASHSQFQSMGAGIGSQLAALPRNGGETAVAAIDKNKALDGADTNTGQPFTVKTKTPGVQQAQVQPPAPAPAAKPAEKPAAPTKPATQAKATPDNCCQGECTSIDMGLSVEAARQ